MSLSTFSLTIDIWRSLNFDLIIKDAVFIAGLDFVRLGEVLKWKIDDLKCDVPSTICLHWIGCNILWSTLRCSDCSGATDEPFDLGSWIWHDRDGTNHRSSSSLQSTDDDFISRLWSIEDFELSWSALELFISESFMFSTADQFSTIVFCFQCILKSWSGGNIRCTFMRIFNLFNLAWSQFFVVDEPWQFCWNI